MVPEFNFVNIIQNQSEKRHTSPCISCYAGWMNKWMNFIIYIPPVKPVAKAQGCILRCSLMFRSFSVYSQVRVRAIIPLLIWHNLAQVAHVMAVIFVVSRSMPYVAYITFVVTGVCVWCNELGIRWHCLYCLCSTHRVSCSITAYRQWAKNIVPYFKSQLFV